MAGPRVTKDKAAPGTGAPISTSTIALETSDLMSLELPEAKLAEARPNATVALDTQDLVEVKPGHTQHVDRAEPSIVIEPEAPPAFTLDDLNSPEVPERGPLDPKTSRPAAPLARAISAPAMDEPHEPPARGGAAHVALVYIVATVALALAIYERWFL